MFLCSTASALKLRTTHYVADVAVADINADGISDIVTCGYADQTGSANVMLGNGDGTFQRAKPSVVSGNPGAIAIGDLNGDGHLDVATADFGIDAEFSNTVSVLLGYGNGAFKTHHEFVTGEN